MFYWWLFMFWQKYVECYILIVSMVSSLQSNSGWVRHCGHSLSNVQGRNLEFFGKTKFTERYEILISENIVWIFGTWNYPVNVVTSDNFSEVSCSYYRNIEHGCAEQWKLIFQRNLSESHNSESHQNDK